MILVLTRELNDQVADLVIQELNTLGAPLVRLDPADFPTAMDMDAVLGPRGWEGKLTGRRRDLDLTQVGAIYYRRPGAPRPSTSLAAEDADWTADESAAGLMGVLASIPEDRWVNHPRRNRTAGSTAISLAVAARCGLPVPHTLITNNPTRAREFVAALPGGKAAYKTLGNGGSSRGGVPYSQGTKEVFAAEIGETVALAAHQFQEWITKAFEVRRTVVGDDLFAGRIDYHSEAARVDFRTDYDSLTYSPYEIPPAIVAGVRDLMRSLNLRYAALDFLVNHDGGMT